MVQHPVLDRRPICVHPGCKDRVNASRCEKHQRTVAAAITAFHEATLDVAPGTKRNYRRILHSLEAFCKSGGLVTVDEIYLEALKVFRPPRPISPRTLS